MVSEPDPHPRRSVEQLGVGAVDQTPSPRTWVRDALDGPATVVLDAVGSNDGARDGLPGADVEAPVFLVGIANLLLDPSVYVSTKQRSLLGSFCYSFAGGGADHHNPIGSHGIEGQFATPMSCYPGY